MKLITAISIPVLAIVFAGCGATHISAAIPEKDAPNKVSVVADQEIGYSPYAVGISKRENYKYSFAIAAKKTIDSGFKYFSISGPEQFVKQYEDRNVTNIQEAYTACMEGKDSFYTTFSVRWMSGTSNCEYIVRSFSEMDGIQKAQHRAIKYTIEMHNEDRKDDLTFNAEEVLTSELIKDLNQKYFTDIKYVD